MSGADWAILVVVVVLFVLSIVPRAGGDRVHPDEPHPGARARGGGQQARRAAGDDARATRSGRSTSCCSSCSSPSSRAPRSSVCCSRAPPARSGVVIGIVLQIVAVLRGRRGRAEDVRGPAHRTRRAARHAAALVPHQLPAAARAVARPHRPRQRRAPGQGPEAGPVRHRGGDPHDGRRRGRRGRRSSARSASSSTRSSSSATPSSAR